MANIIHLGKCSLGEIVKNNSNEREVNPFDKALVCLNSQGYNVASVEEVATARLESRTREIYIGGCVREGCIYIPNKNEIILTRNSPVIAFAERAVALEREGKNFYLTKEELEPFLKDSVNCSFANFPLVSPPYQNPLPSILTSELGNEPITSFLFGKKAKEYGDFIKSQFGLDYLYLYFYSENERKIDSWLVGQVSFHHASKGGLNFGATNSLHYDSNIFGIK